MKRNWILYAMVLPGMAALMLFKYLPMYGILMAFENYYPQKGIAGSAWVGLKYFKQFFASYQCAQVISNTLILSAGMILISFPIPIVFALMMNSFGAQRVKKVTQTIVTMPHFISVVVLVGMMNQIFHSRVGAYGVLMYALTGAYPKNLFASPGNFRVMYIASGIWQSFGWGSIIYLAALSGVSPDLHESAQIDGASRF